MDRAESSFFAFRTLSRSDTIYRLVEALFWSFFVVFHLNNLFAYRPLNGYDAAQHTNLIRLYWESGAIPEINGGFYSSNPPFYYLLMAPVYGLTGSWKLIQVLSFLFYSGGVFCLKILLERLVPRSYLNLALLAFFSFSAESLNFAYMIFNYNLGHELAIYSLTLVCWSGIQSRWSWKRSVLLGVLLGLGLLTSLSGLAAVAACLFGIAILPGSRMRHRLLGVSLALFLTIAVNMPYYLYKTKTYNCYFCTKNRDEARTAYSQVYPPTFYYRFNLEAFEKPYALEHLQDGMWLLLHQTMFSDYFNYLVGDRYSSLVVDSNTDMTRTGIHYVDAQKIFRMKALNYLGLGLAAAMILALALGASRALGAAVQARKEDFPAIFLTASFLAFFAQFLAYIHKYPNYVNIHSGYLYPGFFALVVLMGLQIRRKWSAVALTGYSALFAVASCITFWLK